MRAEVLCSLMEETKDVITRFPDTVNIICIMTVEDFANVQLYGADMQELVALFPGAKLLNDRPESTREKSIVDYFIVGAVKVLQMRDTGEDAS